MLLFMALGALAGFWITWLTITVAHWLQVGSDESGGIQKFHDHWVPRLGGVPVFAAFTISLVTAALISGASLDGSLRLIICTLPAFGIGLLEDVTRRAGVAPRLLFTMIAAGLGWWLLDGRLDRLDLPLIDELLVALPLAAFALTLIAAGGVAHAVNIIDGYNGLSGFFIAAALAGMGLVAWQAGDGPLLRMALIAMASVLGFLAWNFPYGRIFLGDSGAYFLGFLVAEMAILLVHRNPQVSAWCPLLLMIYPVWETVFSMVRRGRAGGLSHMGQPDARHLHQLIYRRLMKRYIGSTDPRDRILRNSMTSVYLWVLALLSIIPAVLFWNDTALLMGFTVLFALSYLVVYCAIIRFRVPRWLVAKPLDPSRTVRRPPALRAGAAGAGIPASAFPAAASASAQTRTAVALPGTAAPAAHPPR